MVALVVSMITLPDGVRVELCDWTTSALYSRMTCFSFDDALTLEGARVELGYTHRSDEPPPKVARLTLFEWAQKSGCSYWDLRCHVAEYLARKHRGLRSGAQWRRMNLHLLEDLSGDTRS